MKPPQLAYVPATSVAEALEILAGESVTILAGGQSLIPQLNMRKIGPRRLLDINPIQSLACISWQDDHVAIGAMVRQRTLERSEETGRPYHRILADATQLIGSFQIRNRGTIGGSLVYRDPAAELPAVVLALGGVMEVRSLDGSRHIPAEDWCVDPESPLGPTELLVCVRLETSLANWRWGIAEIARRPRDRPAAGAVVGIRQSSDGEITECRVVLYGMLLPPKRLREVENQLVGSPLSAATASSRLVTDHASARAASHDGPSMHTEYAIATAASAFRQALARAAENDGPT